VLSFHVLALRERAGERDRGTDIEGAWLERAQDVTPYHFGELAPEAKRYLMISASFTTANYCRAHGLTSFVITSDRGLLDELEIADVKYVSTLDEHAEIFEKPLQSAVRVSAPSPEPSP